MWFFRLQTDYFDMAPLVRAGEAAEILYVRMQAYAAGEQLVGVVPREVVPRLAPTKTQARVKALLREGLLEPVEGGYRLLAGLDQETDDTLERKRAATKKRVAAHRARKAAAAADNPPRNGTSNGAGNALHGPLPLFARNPDLDAAACGSSTSEPPPPLDATDLPMRLQILRASLEAHRLEVRWDRLSPEQAAQMEALSERHGDPELVRVALANHRPDRPAVYAQAWLGAWSELDRRGRLELVPTADPCPHPGHLGTTRHCVQCASEVHGGHR